MTGSIPGNSLPALLAALLWGGGDFSGGMSVKHGGSSLGAALRVVLMSHAASLSVLVAVALARGDRFPHGAAAMWAVMAGFSGCISLSLFYIALSRGAMGASAAISGLLAAALPALVSAGLDGRPGARQLVGFLTAGAAIALIAGGPGRESRSTMVLAVTSGLGFGFYFTAARFAGEGGLVWPMAILRMSSIALATVLLAGQMVWRRSSDHTKEVPVNRPMVGWALSGAVLDTSGNLLYMAATQMGRLDVAAVLASLYPATTILLAAGMLRERPTRRQGLGMAVAVFAVILIML